MSVRQRMATAALALCLAATAMNAFGQTRDGIENGIPVPSRDSLGKSESPASSLNPGLRDDPNSPIGPSLGTAGAGPDGSLNPSSGTMANPGR